MPEGADDGYAEAHGCIDCSRMPIRTSGIAWCRRALRSWSRPTILRLAGAAFMRA